MRFKKNLQSSQERESELAQIRSRFQKGINMWKNKDDGAENKTNTDNKVGQQASNTQYLLSYELFLAIFQIVINK